MPNITNSLTNLIVNDIRVENLERTLAQFDEFQAKLAGLARSAVGKEMGQDLKGVTDEMLKQLGVYDQVIAKEQELFMLASKRVAGENLRAYASGESRERNILPENEAYMDLARRMEQVGVSAENMATKSQAATNTLEQAFLKAQAALNVLTERYNSGKMTADQYAMSVEFIGKEYDAAVAGATNAKQAVTQLTEAERQQIEMSLAMQEARMGGTRTADPGVQADVYRQSTVAVETYDQAVQSLHRTTNNVIRQADELSGQQVRLIDQWAAGGASLELMKARAQGAGITLQQLKQTLADLGYEVEKNTSAGDKWSQGVGGQIRQARAMRYGGLELMAVFSMMSIAIGDQLPASFRELEKSSMLITSGALATAMMGVGAVPGLIVGTILALSVALFSVDQKTQDLNKSLDSMAKKDDLVNTMSKILNVSKETAETFQEIAGKSSDVAAATRDLVDASREMAGPEKTIRMIGEGLGLVVGLLGQAAQGFANLISLSALTAPIMDTLQGGVQRFFEQYDTMQKQRAAVSAQNLVTAVQESQVAEYNKEIAKENEAALKAQADQTKELAKANDTLYDSYVRASDSFNEASERAWTTLNEGLARASQTRADELAKFGEQQRLQAEKNSEAWRKIQDTLRDAEAKAWQTYNDRLYDIETSRRDKLADLEYEQSRKREDEANQREKRAQELADKLYQIERDRIQALANLDFDTALQMSKAKTENEKDEIMYRAMHEREQINQKAENAIEDAMKKRALDEAEAARRKKDLEDEYAHRRMVIQREYQEELITARRSYEEQKKAAIDSYNEQATAQRFAEKQQNEVALNQLAEIERRYKEAAATAQKRYADEMKAAEDRYAKEKALADDRWEDEKKRIEENYREKIDAIQKEWKDFDELHKAKLQAYIDEAKAAALQYQLAAQASGLVPTPQGGGGGSSGFGQNGLEMIVPPGFNNDTFRINASSGERVSITPAATTAATSVNISVEPIFAPMFQQLVQQMVASKVFREGVSLVLNDAVYQG